MSKRIVVVDDVPYVRKILVNILRAALYDVVGEGQNGKEAVELFRKLKPDLITMDVVMPEMSGIEAARAISKIDTEAKIIMISAMSQENLIMDSINAGARDYVLKPFKTADILKAVEHCLFSEEKVTERSKRQEQFK
ncbi:MAG: response regulator [Xanthomonadaceae bacterium]|nr:response regulator [Xanthomonadaceae bacterium]